MKSEANKIMLTSTHPVMLARVIQNYFLTQADICYSATVCPVDLCWWCVTIMYVVYV